MLYGTQEKKEDGASPVPWIERKTKEGVWKYTLYLKSKETDKLHIR